MHTRIASLVLLACLIAIDLAAQTGPRPTAQEAAAFVDSSEAALKALWTKDARIDWVQSNFITDDTEVLAAASQQEVTAAAVGFAKGAARFNDLRLPYDVERKLSLLRLSLTLPASSDPAEQAELSRISVGLESDYGRGKFTGSDGASFTLNDASRLLASSRNPDTLLMVWKGWHYVAAPMRKRYARMISLTNKGARELGYPDAGAMWRSKYDMPPDEFAKELDRLWTQVKPLYDALHAYVRTKLGEKYGTKAVPPGGPIPAHLLGNMWAQEWNNIYDLVAPPAADPGYDLTTILKERQMSEEAMVKVGEQFFVSIGFEPLPKTFWSRSLFVKPRDREVVCHASAWSLDFHDDLRIKMCIEINEEDFQTIHHELGHNFYQRAYNRQPVLYQDGANDGFHEALGDAVGLFITPEYLQQVGLIGKVPDPKGDLGLLMRMALSKVAFLPFGLVVDQWRWKVFSGEIPPERYTSSWWELRAKYQGVAPPVTRDEASFDPGAKYHVAASVPYTRYFLASILQFQFVRAMAREMGATGPLHRTSIYGSKQVGERLQKMMAMGSSRPWPEALEALTGEKRLDASAMVEYFAPLKKWLDEQNKGKRVGY